MAPEPMHGEADKSGFPHEGKDDDTGVRPTQGAPIPSPSGLAEKAGVPVSLETNSQSRPATVLDRNGIREKFKTIQDLITTPMPYMPAVFHSGYVNATKRTTQFEKEVLLSADSLKRIVHLPTMLTDLDAAGKRLASSYTLDWDDPEHILLAASCMPDNHPGSLPRTIWIEGDVVTWCDATILRPATGALRACKRADGRLVNTLPYEHPSLSSSPSGKAIPDRILVQATKIYSEPGKADKSMPVATATIEIKTPNVLSVDLLFGDRFQPDGSQEPYVTQYELVESDIASRILMQLQSQMVFKKVFVAVLSSHDTTIIFRRYPSEPDTLYMSSPCRSSEWKHVHPTFAAFCSFALADGLIDLSTLGGGNALEG
ncbi:hypothetical protein FKP32DRAFT_1678682 [Trametes sanguinea]|nr:hypothetical protein FKP32DRAFT_1678682 [Trametes sanguinea]